MRPWLWGTLHGSGNLFTVWLACELWAGGAFALSFFLLLCSSIVLGLSVGMCEHAQQLCLRVLREGIEASNQQWAEIARRLSKGA